ncbi:MAG: hypothetical protein ACYDD5_01085 [Sulfuricurvum sp.]
MGFAGLYTVYKYYSVGIFVFLHREGAYDYEEICDFKKQTGLVKVFLTPSRANAYVESLRIK